MIEASGIDHIVLHVADVANRMSGSSARAARSGDRATTGVSPDPPVGEESKGTRDAAQPYELAVSYD